LTEIAEIRVLDATSWDRELAGAGVRYRFSQRADAIAACERAYPEYSGRLFEAVYSDGSRTLFPGVIARRRLHALSAFLAMPLGWEGTPIALCGDVTAAQVKGFFRSLGGVGALRISGGAAGSPPPLGRVKDLSTHVLDLTPGFDALWNHHFTGKNRNTCRKAARSGVVVRKMETPQGADLYYDLYAPASRHWGHAEPSYPRALFLALAASAHVEFWLAFKDDVVVSGAVLLMGSEDVFYWSGAMAREFAAISPSNLLLRDVVRSACERGYRSMDFGASDGLPGVQKFKESFGAEPRRFRSVSVRTLGNRVAEVVAAALRRSR
jgi:hypothetical protein